MKYLTDEIWGKLPINDFRPRFFVETFIEKLSIKTPHFYQSRLMNVFSSCTEVLVYIDEYQTNDKNGGYIISSLAEISSCLSADPVAKDLYAYMDNPRTQLFKKISGGDFNPSQLNRLSVLCRAILSREDEYSNLLLKALAKSISGQANLEQKERILSDIYVLTGLYVTHLLNKGYSPTYLFNRSEFFTRINNYSGRSFQEQFNFVTERLRNYTTTYDVYFSLHVDGFTHLFLINDDPDFEFYEDFPGCIKEENLGKLKKEFDPNVIAKATIKATDYVTASWRIKDKFDKLIDALTALEPKLKIQVSSYCVTIQQNKKNVHTKILNINLLINFLSSEGGTYFSSSSTTIRHTLTSLNEQGKEHMSRSLRYFRLARESVSLEQKLLNLWISLESLFSDGETSILVNIEDYIPQIYAVSGLLRRVRYLKDLLVKNKIPTTQLIRENLMPGIDKFDACTTDAHIFLLLRNESAVKELFESLGEKEHLKYKCKTTYDELKDNKAIADRIKRSELDVTRQLRRIYFLRNKITHTGHFANIRPQLVMHLFDYLAVCYAAISISAEKTVQKNSHSIDDLLAAYKMGVDVVVGQSTSGKIDKFEQLIPVPII
jgi:hypothetical protein